MYCGAVNGEDVMQVVRPQQHHDGPTGATAGHLITVLESAVAVSSRLCQNKAFPDRSLHTIPDYFV